MSSERERKIEAAAKALIDGWWNYEIKTYTAEGQRLFNALRAALMCVEDKWRVVQVGTVMRRQQADGSLMIRFPGWVFEPPATLVAPILSKPPEVTTLTRFSTWDDTMIIGRDARAAWEDTRIGGYTFEELLTMSNEAHTNYDGPGIETRFLGKTAEQWAEVVGEKGASEDRLFERAEAEVQRLRDEIQGVCERAERAESDKRQLAAQVRKYSAELDEMCDAEAAARDFAQALDDIASFRPKSYPAFARNALARHPSFSGEEGTDA